MTADRFHLSQRSGDWKECRARIEACPFSGQDDGGTASHPDLAGIVRATAAAHAAGLPFPTRIGMPGGQSRTIGMDEDGTVRVGSRRYHPDGTKRLSESAARSARRRKRM